MLDHRVGSGEDQARLAVVEPHQVGRLARGAAHLDDLAVLVRVPDDVAVNADTVADRRLHVRTSLPWERCPQAGRYKPRRFTPRCNGPNPPGTMWQGCGFPREL